MGHLITHERSKTSLFDDKWMYVYQAISRGTVALIFTRGRKEVPIDLRTRDKQILMTTDPRRGSGRKGLVGVGSILWNSRVQVHQLNGLRNEKMERGKFWVTPSSLPKPPQKAIMLSTIISVLRCDVGWLSPIIHQYCMLQNTYR